MLSRLLSIGSFFTGGGWIPLAIAAAVAVSAGAGGAWWIQSARIEGYQRQVDAADRALSTVKANRDALSRDNDKLAGIIERQQREADAADDKAKATLASQKAAASVIARQLRDSLDQTETLIQQIEDARHARPIVVSQTVVDAFDPLIRIGLERLRCVQRAANRGEAGDGCRVSVSDAAGGSGAAGATSGAGDFRPGFETQLRLLNDLWRLHDWGASCYRDKAAIAASQQQPESAP